MYITGELDSRFSNSLSFVFVIGCFPRRAYHHIRNKVRYTCTFCTGDLKEDFRQLFNTGYYGLLSARKYPRFSLLCRGSMMFLGWENPLSDVSTDAETASSTLRLHSFRTSAEARDWHDLPVNEGKLSSNFMKIWTDSRFKFNESTREIWNRMAGRWLQTMTWVKVRTLIDFRPCLIRPLCPLWTQKQEEFILKQF